MNYTENIKLYLKLIYSTTGHKKNTINALINQYEKKELLLKLINYWDDLDINNYKEFCQYWAEYMNKEYNYNY